LRGAALALRDELREVRAELEAKTLEYRLIEQERELFSVERTAHQQHAQELEKRITELEAYNTRLRDYNAGLAQESCELQAKLATPVRLPGMMFIKVSGSAVPVMHGERVKERVRAAGFKCVGDE
jgi:predicted nuclease with TOPRIM domain